MKIPLRKKFQLELYRQYRKTQTKLHPLTYLFWECTLNCNMNCVHCGSDCTKQSGVKDMPASDFLRVIDQIKPEVTPEKTIIAITGGEPLVRKDLEFVGKELYQRRFPWGIVTNGYALTPQRLEQLIQSGLHSLTISLDGLNNSHNWFRGKKKAFEQAVNAIANAAQYTDLKFDVATCAHQKNFNELQPLKKLLIELGVKRWRIFTVFPKGRAVNHPELFLDDRQFTALFDFINNTRKEKQIHSNYGCEGFLGNYELEARDNPFFCRAGINIGSVLIDGSISACPSLRNDYIQGNIYRDNFMDVWNNRYEIMRNRSWTQTGICNDCKVYKWCEGNGLHLRDEKTGELLYCHYKKLGY